MPLSSLDESKALFIRRWGEMANYWGINRTMAEIHAMLFVSTEPACTDDVMETLQISRGNASMNLRSLVDWGLVQRTHLRGDRKEYFAALTDVWKMFETIIRQRSRREVEPILETIRHCRGMVSKGEVVDGAGPPSPAATYLRRLDAMSELLRAVGVLVDVLLRVGPKEVHRLTVSAAGLAGSGQAASRDEEK